MPPQDRLWETLNLHPSRFRSSSAATPTWVYIPPDLTSPTQYLTSLDLLSKSLPTNAESSSAKETGTGSTKQSWKPKYQHALQTLTDLTGYLTTQTYTLPSGGFSGFGIAGYTTSSSLATPQQEELRKEIRALKGLVLSRWGSSVDDPISCPLSCLILQTHFYHSKGFICHEYAPTMICDFYITAETLLKCGLLEDSVTTTERRSRPAFSGPLPALAVSNNGGVSVSVILTEQCHGFTSSLATVLEPRAAISFPRFSAPCVLFVRLW